MKHVFAYANIIPKGQSILRGAIVLGHKDLQTHLHLLSCMLSVDLVHVLEITFLRAECYNAEPDLALGIPILPYSSISFQAALAPLMIEQFSSFLRRGHYITRSVDLRVSAVGLNTAAPAAILPTGCLNCRCTEKGGHCGPRQAITSAYRIMYQCRILLSHMRCVVSVISWPLIGYTYDQAYCSGPVTL